MSKPNLPAPTQADAVQVSRQLHGVPHPRTVAIEVSAPPKSDSPTPRTDDQIDHPYNIHLDNGRAERLGQSVCTEVVTADFARQLERELTHMDQAHELCAERRRSLEDAVIKLRAENIALKDQLAESLSDTRHSCTIQEQMSAELAQWRAVADGLAKRVLEFERSYLGLDPRDRSSLAAYNALKGTK